MLATSAPAPTLLGSLNVDRGLGAGDDGRCFSPQRRLLSLLPEAKVSPWVTKSIAEPRNPNDHSQTTK
jgi:hypothetical protein